MTYNTIDLWFEELSAGDEEYRHYWYFLDENEQAKAQRFVQKKHRLQYVISHGKLRTVLAGYTGLGPEKIRFAQEASGKPYILADDKPHEVNFNLSHSGDKMLVAVSVSGSVGVDMEVWDDRIDSTLIADACFADLERQFWQALPDAEKTAVFYQFWVRKESFVKAVGAGISLGVAKVVTSIEGAARFLSIPDGYGLAHDWHVLDLDLGTGMSGALTVKDISPPRVRLKRLCVQPYLP
ncbi:MAG: 4'-phosphopantetheinyl transferase superfamily protein [Methylovulum sp.]|nr:4'-phosphopantetheinyl transferase superfamily protein [Methylovulum sp.]